MTESSGRSVLEGLDAIPKGTWQRCLRCAATLYQPKLRRLHGVCPHCSWHLRLTPEQRLAVLVDAGSFQPLDEGLASADPLQFTDSRPYRQRRAEAEARTGSVDAAHYGTATVGGRRIVLALVDFGFMGGSMGTVVGEKIARAAELALRLRVPLVTCSGSGGARMQEGIHSLMQMAKTAAVLRRLSDGGVPHISILTDPVYGGVSASFASLADVILAEPGARAGFAGPQIIEQTIRRRLPEGFQTAEFLLEHGHIDAVVPRGALHQNVARIVAIHQAAETGANRTAPSSVAEQAPAPAVRDAWETVGLARHPHRPLTDDYLDGVFDSFVELRGDRSTADDPALVGGLAVLAGVPVVVVAHRKGRGTAQAVARNFGMPHPSGYRKARRLYEYAERFSLPLVTLVDTAGAYPGLRAEQENQSGAIAANLAVLAGLRTPVVCVVVGEGGSGGALALAVGDRLLMLQNATFSVISPEGCATILFGDASRAPQAARALRLTAPDLATAGLVDEVIPEPPGGAHESPGTTVAAVREAVARHLAELLEESIEVVLKERQARLRSLGPVLDADGDDPTSDIPSPPTATCVPSCPGDDVADLLGRSATSSGPGRSVRVGARHVPRCCVPPRSWYGWPTRPTGRSALARAAGRAGRARRDRRRRPAAVVSRPCRAPAPHRPARRAGDPAAADTPLPASGTAARPTGVPAGRRCADGRCRSHRRTAPGTGNGSRPRRCSSYPAWRGCSVRTAVGPGTGRPVRWSSVRPEGRA